MGIIQIREARREGARVVIGLAGVSGSGKTYSAIQLAYGLANGNAGKVGLLDTENRRGSLYADILPGRERFMIGDLVAPFSPARYAEAILAFQEAGVEVLVIDSVTHEWEGAGGCDDIANDGDPKVPRWNRAKREHKRFMNALLQSDMHIIACIRARDKVRIEKDGRGKSEFIPIGVQPIQEKNFMFELTASLLMHEGGQHYERTKVPADLLHAFPGDRYITPETGRLVRQWVDGGGIVDPEVERYRNRLLTVAEKGEAYVRTAWLKTPPAIQEALGVEFFDALTASARAYDEQRALADDAPSETVAQINDALREKPAGLPLDFGARKHGDPS